MSRSFTGRTVVTLVALALALCAPAAAVAQNIVLPAARTTAVPEFDLLENILEHVRELVQSDTVSAHRVHLDRTLNRLALAPFLQDELVRLYLARTTADTMRELYNHTESRPSIVYLREVASRLSQADQSTSIALRADSSTSDRAGDILRAKSVRARNDTLLVSDLRSRTRRVRKAAEKKLAQRCSTIDDSGDEVHDRLCAVGELETGELVQQLKRDAKGSEARLAALDSLSRIARAVVIRRKIIHSWILPVRSREHALAFWRQEGFSTLNVGAVSGSGQEGAAFTELASPFLHAFRVSANSVLSAASSGGAQASGGTNGGSAATARRARGNAAANETAETGDDKAVNRFLNGGGLFNVGFALPLMHWGAENGAGDALLLLAPRFGGTLPAFGATQGDSALLYDGGLEAQLKSADVADGVGVFVQTRASVSGGSRPFLRAMGLADDSKASFTYATASAGLLLGNKYLITASRTYAGPKSLRKFGWQVGVTAMRAGVVATH
ncbi:MAG TPA: hypothetical protein VFJ74_17180 [Gemmatimonadaceae bacterium]|nr:hypothetical protein [Gemmatimonadaceae bacterium]